MLLVPPLCCSVLLCCSCPSLFCHLLTKAACWHRCFTTALEMVGGVQRGASIGCSGGLERPWTATGVECFGHGNCTNQKIKRSSSRTIRNLYSTAAWCCAIYCFLILLEGCLCHLPSSHVLWFLSKCPASGPDSWTLQSSQRRQRAQSGGIRAKSVLEDGVLQAAWQRALAKLAYPCCSTEYCIISTVTCAFLVLLKAGLCFTLPFYICPSFAPSIEDGSRNFRAATTPIEHATMFLAWAGQVLFIKLLYCMLYYCKWSKCVFVLCG